MDWIAHTVPNHSAAVEVVHEVGDLDGGGMWFYRVHGSGVYFKPGRTRAFPSHHVAVSTLCSEYPTVFDCKLGTGHMLTRDFAERVNSIGLDTLVYPRFHENKLVKFELHSATVRVGRGGCFAAPHAHLFSRGWGGVSSCSCVPRHDLNCDGGRQLQLVNATYSRPSERAEGIRRETTFPYSPLLVRKAPTGLTFDLARQAASPACNGTVQAALAVCVINSRVSRGGAWAASFFGVTQAALLLFRCWSFFIQHPRKHRLIWNRVDRRYYTDALTPWQAAIVRSMGATFTRAVTECAILWAVPTRKFQQGWAEAWFRQPSDAQELSARIAQTPATSSSLVRLRILVSNGIEEEHNAWWFARTFVARVNRRPPQGVSGANLWSSREIGRRPLREQVELVRRHGIVVAMHGWQNVLFAFLRPGSVVLELIDFDRLVPLYLQLAIDVGAHAFFMVRAPSVNESAIATLRLGLPHVLDAKRPVPAISNGNLATGITDESVLQAIPTLLAVSGQSGAKIPYDGIPVFGGAQALALPRGDCHRCGLEEAGALRTQDCCMSKEAWAAYADGGFACSHRCLGSFASLSKLQLDEGCARWGFACRLH